MRTTSTRWTLLLVGIAVLAGSMASADDERGGEVGVLLGAVAADKDLTGDGGAIDATVGLRGGSVFAPRWGWFIDGLYSQIGTEGNLGDARTVIGRTGFELMFQPERNWRWFLSLGGGWMVVDYEDGGFFHRPLAAAGFGQRIRVGENTRLRWELRAETTLDDARLDDRDITQGHFLLGYSWGPGTTGTPRVREARPTKPEATEPNDDLDGDGVRNKRDRCPDTPPGARVDEAGCPFDDDGDGVFDGLDRCPRTPAGEPVNAEGCPADADADGVVDASDFCADTPVGARVDEWGCPVDSDGDGVADGIDGCADTPRAARVDGSGCPLDGDGDGVYDGLDRCPDTAAGRSVDASGCAADGDGDGVDDETDRCPGTPRGVAVDPTGCPKDSDGDGVHDGIDACPGTPRSVKSVDSRGCAQQGVFDAGRDTVVLEGVNFGFDGVTLTPESRGILDGVAKSLRGSTGYRVEIAGHTDSSGEASYNQWLSTRRAEVVRDYLVDRGVDGSRLLVRGYGESRPVADESVPGGRARNRRVELKKLDPASR